MWIKKLGQALGKGISTCARTSSKSPLATRPLKINTLGLKYKPQLEADIVEIERKLSDFAQQNREFLQDELSRLFCFRSTKEQDAQKLLYYIKDVHDLTIITNLSHSYTPNEICDLMKLPNKRILQCAHSYNYYTELGNKQISPKELMNILNKYPNLEEKYFSRLFQIEIPIAGQSTRKLTLDEIKQILKSSKTQNKFKRVMSSNSPSETTVKSTKLKIPPSGAVPRFIYHMTNKENYLKILNSGKLSTSYDEGIGQGIFFTDLENLFKHWRHDYSWGKESLQSQLLKQCLKGSDEIVILKVPTQNLDYKKLAVRSQQKLFSHLEGNEEEFVKFVEKDLMHVEPEEKNVPNMVLRSINRYLDKLSRQDNHIYTGSPVCEAKLFKQRKKAIEYIYSEPIEIENITKIGEVNVSDLRSCSKYDPTHPIRSIFRELLSNTPEVKGVNLIRE